MVPREGWRIEQVWLHAKVTKEDAKRGLEDQYGGEEESLHPTNNFNTPAFKFAKMSNAYMLVYVRESDWATIMGPIAQEAIPATVHQRQEVHTPGCHQTCCISRQLQIYHEPLFTLLSSPRHKKCYTAFGLKRILLLLNVLREFRNPSSLGHA